MTVIITYLDCKWKGKVSVSVHNTGCDGTCECVT